MTMIVCLDDRGGMTFNGRRLSRDRVVTQDILNSSDGALYITKYSQPLFSEFDGQYTVVDSFDGLSDKDFALIENLSPSTYKNSADKIIIYKWNRTYPYDTVFDIDLSAEGYILSGSVEFEGYSHEKITKEIFER